ncbi:LytTR family transcriptional regulator [Rhodospirillaceae bacterium KN72]|uniref:LytTR family transcriptional regulator n=1 Tax=Pacificispira spongiicola TaxID=2729598 RepID=A0A7Y0HCM6_9PROT|nr:LytTR family transcriptional regulator [Pacificispira spongiicola]
MNDSAVQFTKRRMQTLLRNRSLWIALAAVTAILTVAGPFGTSGTLPPAPRFFYWAAIVIACFFTGATATTLVMRLLKSGGIGHYPALATGAAVAGILNFAIVSALTALWTGLPLLDRVWIDEQALPVILITMVVSAAYDSIAIPKAGAAERRADEPPAILRRVPFDKRGTLISLSVQDHYVDIATTAGRELVLMRLSDAIDEAGPGHRIHRSHWVASGQIRAIKRDGARAILTLSDGRDLPVSRSYVPALKDAGLL